MPKPKKKIKAWAVVPKNDIKFIVGWSPAYPTGMYAIFGSKKLAELSKGYNESLCKLRKINHFTEVKIVPVTITIN